MKLFATRRVGVDIGSTAVRVAEIEGVDSVGYAFIRRASIVPLPEGAVVGGDIRLPIVVGQAISAAIRQAGVPKQGFVVGLCSRFSALGRLASPDGILPEERTGVIRRGRDAISPTVPMNEAAISWNTVNTVVDGDRVLHTLNVAVARQSEVEMLSKVCALAQCQPQAIDLQAAALLRSMTRVAVDDTDVVTIVDIGATKTLVVTREGPHLRSISTLPSVGGRPLTNVLMSTLNLSYEEAEERKRQMHLTSIAGQEIDPHTLSAGSELHTEAEIALTKAADAMIEEIARAVSEDGQRYMGQRSTQGVLLTGGGSRLIGLADRLGARLGVPCGVASQWAEIQYSRHTAALLDARGLFSPTTADTVVSDLSVAVGLALWRAPK